MHLITKSISTLFGIGYLPGSGTIASGIIFILSYFFFLPLDIITRLALLIVFSIILWLATEYFRNAHNYKDPSFIVSDEVLASLLIVSFLPLDVSYFVWAFVIFRILDITKWLGIFYIQRLPQTVGIMADDILAALYTLTGILTFQLSIYLLWPYLN